MLIDNEVSITTALELFTTTSSGLMELSLFHLKENELEGFSAPLVQKLLPKSNSILLKAINLRSNNIGVQDLKNFLPYFKCVPLLEHLNLSDNPLGDEGAMAMIPVLSMLQLSELSFSACDISTKGACCLLDLLASLECPLRSLDLSHNDLGRSIATPLANFLRRGVVDRLDIGDIRLGSSGCLDFHDALQEMPNLTHLILKKNRLGATGATLLCKLVSMYDSIKVIDFSSNLLDLQCLQSVALQLQVQSTLNRGALELVDLRYNLADGFEAFKTIKKPEVLLSGVGGGHDDDP